MKGKGATTSQTFKSTTVVSEVLFKYAIQSAYWHVLDTYSHAFILL